MSTTDASMFVIRRLDTGEFFKRRAPSYLKNWGPSDSRLRNWTLDIEQAKTYTYRGAVSVASQAYPYDVEIVRLGLAVVEIVRKFPAKGGN